MVDPPLALQLPSPPPSEGLPSPLSSSSDSTAPPLSDLPSGSLSQDGDDDDDDGGGGPDEDEAEEYDMMASRDWPDSDSPGHGSKLSSVSSSSQSQRSSTDNDSTTSNRLKLSFPDPTALDDGDGGESEGESAQHEAYSFLLDTQQPPRTPVNASVADEDEDLDADATPLASRTVERGESYRVGDIHDWVQTTVSVREMDSRVQQAWEGAAVRANPAPPSQQQQATVAAATVKSAELDVPALQPVAPSPPSTEQQQQYQPLATVLPAEETGHIPRRLVVLAALLVALATASSYKTLTPSSLSAHHYPSCTSLHPTFASPADLAPCLASPHPPPTAASSSASATTSPNALPRSRELSPPIAPPIPSSSASSSTALSLIVHTTATPHLDNNQQEPHPPRSSSLSVISLGSSLSSFANNLSNTIFIHSPSPLTVEVEEEPLPVEEAEVPRRGIVEVVIEKSLGARRTLGRTKAAIGKRWESDERLQRLLSKGREEYRSLLLLGNGPREVLQDVLISLPRHLPTPSLSLPPLPTSLLFSLPSLPFSLPPLPTALPFSLRANADFLTNCAEAYSTEASRVVSKAHKGLRHILRGEIGIDWSVGKLVVKACEEVESRHQGACVAERALVA
ncbi:hypothetical protein RQP46_011126 [Phenoliferia psychrophenolica]